MVYVCPDWLTERYDTVVYGYVCICVRPLPTPAVIKSTIHCDSFQYQLWRADSHITLHLHQYFLTFQHARLFQTSTALPGGEEFLI